MDMHSAPAADAPLVQVGKADVTAEDVLAVARGNARIELGPDALAEMAASRARIDALAAEPRPVYGVSTGFGALAVRHISLELRAQLQRSLVRSHAAAWARWWSARSPAR